MRTATKRTKEAPKSLDIRNDLKQILAKEISALPKLIGGLEGKERLDAILKLLPLVVPKAKPIAHWQGEDDDFDPVGTW